MPVRDNPYGAFNFVVDLGDGVEGARAGFSDVIGLGAEITYAEYRNGSDKANRPRKIPTLTTTADVVLRRGVTGDQRLFTWFKTVRDGATEPRDVTVHLLNEAREVVLSWRLTDAQPRKWVGPTLAARAKGEIAMEELHLTVESIDVVS